MNRLDGKIVLITGGTSGIGAATAKLFKAEGATVIVTGSTPDSVASAGANLPGIEVAHSDAADPSAIKALLAQVKQEHGRMDVLFVNAGISKMTPAEKVDEAQFDAVFNVNTRGAFFIIKGASELMPDGGSIILTSSIAHAKGMAGLSIYSASKAAVRSFARTFAAELAPRNIRVNVISPGVIDTPILRKMGVPAEQIPAMHEQFASKVPLRRVGRPEEIASAALFFASSDSSYVTGADLPVDGGALDLG